MHTAHKAMKKGTIYTINVNGRLLTTEKPLVMGVINVTPDSFYDSSRVQDKVVLCARQMLDDGAAILDVGACSTRPSATLAEEKEELLRLHRALDLLDKECPDAVVSIDTFRAKVVRECVKEHNVSIINDVSGYEWDSAMLDAVADTNIPYVLTHTCGKAGEQPVYDNLLPDVMRKLSQKMWELHQRGAKDVIIDPGFGFAKSLDENYELLAHLQEFALFDAPLLVGVSRKSMITKVLGCTAGDALNGTTALNVIALTKGANILRVHDVKEAVEAVSIFCKMQECE